MLNAGASLSYDKKSWDTSRNVALQGEAYFDVVAGTPSKVTTSNAVISVTGTKFNVAQYQNYLSVACYEGSVEVQIGNMKYALEKGEQLSLIDSKLSQEQTSSPNPSWVANKSSFKSTPLHFILDELARQYEVQLKTDSIDKSVIFTGSFTHQNLDTALQSITIPLKLSYRIDGANVRLVKED
jgi:ferric-dicitrate binding protein FerR (iron transport regulator)